MGYCPLRPERSASASSATAAQHKLLPTGSENYITKPEGCQIISHFGVRTTFSGMVEHMSSTHGEDAPKMGRTPHFSVES